MGWPEFFADKDVAALPDEERWMLFNELSQKDPEISKLKPEDRIDLATQAWEKHLPDIFGQRAQDMRGIQASADTLRSVAPAPIPGVMGGVNQLLTGISDVMSTGKDEIADFRQMALEDEGLSQAVTRPALVGLDSALEITRRFPGAAAQTGGALTRGLAENAAAMPEIMEHPIMSILGPGLATQLVKAIAPDKYEEMKLSAFEESRPIAEFGSEAMQAGQEMTAPQLHDTGWTANLAGKVSGQVPNLGAFGLAGATGGLPATFTLSEMMLTGSNAERIEQETGKQAPTLATMMALPGAAAETLVFGKALKLIPGAGKPGWIRDAIGTVLGEGATEGLQQTLERAGVKIMDPNFEVFSDEGKAEIWEASKDGATLGLLFHALGMGSRDDFDYEKRAAEKELVQSASNFDKGHDQAVIEEPSVYQPTPKQVRATKAGAMEEGGAVTQFDAGYTRISQNKSGEFDVEMFDDDDRSIGSQTFPTIGEANAAASQGPPAHRGADPRMDAVIDEYNALIEEAPTPADAAKWVKAGENVRRVTKVADDQINSVAAIAEDLGMPVEFFVDGVDAVEGAASEGVRGVQAADGTLVVRYDQGNAETTSQTIVKALVEKSVRLDPSVAVKTAEIIKSNNPGLWDHVSRKAGQQGISDLPGMLGLAAEASFRDVITAMENPVQVSRLSSENDNYLASKLRGVESVFSDALRGFIKNNGGDFLLPHARTGGLLHAMRTSPGYMRLVRDSTRLRGLAATADSIRDLIESGRGMLSEVDQTQPLVMVSLDPGSIGDVYQTFNFNADQMPGVYKFLNKWVYPNLGIETIEKEVKERGGEIDDTIASAQARDLWRSRAMDKIMNTLTGHMKPAMKKINALNGNRNKNHEQFSNYITAHAALERNAVLAKRGENKHSGMTNEEAQSILDNVAADPLKNRIFASAMMDVLQVNDRSLEMLVQEGLISRESFNNVKQTYQFYMPLRSITGGDAALDIEAELGIRPDKVAQDIGVSGDVLQSVRGRTTGGISPVIDEALRDLVVRANWAERNRALKSLAQFSRQYGGQYVKVRDGSPNPENVNEIGFKENGKEMTIKLKDGMGLASGFTEIAPRKLGIFMKGVKGMTGIMSRFATTLSIPFWFVNLPRDLITAGIQTEPGVVSGDIMKGIGQAARALAQNEFSDSWGKLPVDSEWQAIIEEFKSNGGKLSFMGLKEMGDVVSEMKQMSDYAMTNPIAWGKRVLRLLDSTSGILENTTRVSAYKAARDAGRSPQQAAAFARRLTVDFGRRTQRASEMNDWFMFFNAGMQGTSRIFEGVWKNKEARKAINRAAMGAATLAIYNAAFGGEDEDTGESNWDTRVSEADKDRNLIIMKPDMSGEYYKIPMPPGYSIFTRVGYFMGDAFRGRMLPSPGDMAINTLTAVASEFSPMSGARIRSSGYKPVGRDMNLWDVGRFIMPDAAKIPIDMAMNQNQWGSPIMPDRIGPNDTTPDSERYFKSVDPTIKLLTDGLNRLGGGSSKYPGELMDVDTSYSPETFEYLLTHALTGMGQFANRLSKLSWKAVRDPDSLEASDFPIWRRFHGEPNDYQAKDAYYSVREELTAVKSQVKGFFEGDVTAEEMSKFDERNGWKVPLVDLLDHTERQLKELDGDEAGQLRLMKLFVREFDANDPASRD